MTIDLTGFRELPDGFLESLEEAQACCSDIEIVNPSPAVQRYLRAAAIDSILICGSTQSLATTGKA